MDSYPTEISISWSSDLDGCQIFFNEAINSCAKSIPGCIFQIDGAGEIAGSTYTANYILENAVKLTYKGWNIDSSRAASMLNSILNMAGGGADFVIILTNQSITTHAYYDNYEYHSRNAAIITLKDCETAIDTQNMTTLLLKHVIWHFFCKTDTPSNYCIDRACIMSPMVGPNYMKQLAQDEEELGLDSFCHECREKLRKSPYWNEAVPSIVKQ